MKNSFINKMCAVFIMALFTLLASNTSYSQWSQTSGPVGGDIYSFALSGTNVLAGGLGSVFISSNNGVSWSNLGTGGPPDGKIYGIAVKNNLIFTATFGAPFGGGVYKSTDNGATWNISNNGIPYTNITAVAVYGNYIFASAYGGGTYRSSDDGNSWTMVNAAGSSMGGFVILGNAIYTAPGNSMIKSTDYGNTWTTIVNGITDLSILSLFSDGTNLYAGTELGHIYVSTNGGTSWTSISNGIPATYWIGAITVNSNKLYAGTEYGTYESTNSGASWSPDPNFSTPVVAFIKNGANLFAGTYSGGIYITSNNGASWNQSITGLVNTSVYNLGIFGDKIFAGCWGGSIFYTTDEGGSWSPRGSGVPLSGNPITDFAAHGSNIYATTMSGIYTSVNTGSSWSLVNWPVSNPDFAFKIMGSNFFIASRYGVYKSTDAGATWTNSLASEEIVDIALSGNNVFVSAYLPNNMYLSTDNGNTYNNINNNLPPNLYINSIAVSGSSVFISSDTAGIYISTNMGSSWSAANNGLTDLFIKKLYAHGNTVFAATEGGLFSTTNNGVSWTNISTGFFTNFGINSMIELGTDLYAGTISHGVWKRSLDEMMPNYSVTGQITYKDNNQPVPAGGFVKAIFYDPNSTDIYRVDSTGIGANGMFTLTKTYQQLLYIMVYQNDDLLQFVPAYYPNTIDWTQATTISPVQNMNNINVSVDRINNTGGQYTISGGVYNSSGTLSNAVIHAKIGNNYMNYGISVTNGNYIVDKLPAGSYTLTAYRMGYNPVSQNVNITNGNVPNINFNFGSPIGIQPISTQIPKSFNLYQNYPNPFNPETVIKFDIPKDQNVKIVIYDIMGREVSKLIDQEVKAGVYDVKWNGSNYASGVYFYRIETESFVETKKMLLIK